MRLSKLSAKSLFRINFFLTRQFAYVAILFAAIVFVLLPVSVVTYLSFYKMLIPVERVQTPTNFHEAGMVSGQHLSTSIDASNILSFLRENGNLTFSMRINLDAICKYETSYQSLTYSLELSPLHKIQDWLLVNCDSRYIFVAKNKLVPYNLRYWVPPILVDVMKLVRVDHPIVYMKGYQLYDALSNDGATFTLDNPSFLYVHSRKTYLDFVIEWDGIRYYLVNYYFTSIFIGAGSFWVLSSFFCVVSTIFFLNWFRGNEPSAEKKDI